jgi:YD repeat-containing protein
MKVRSLRHAFVISAFAALLLSSGPPAHACGASLSISPPDLSWHIHITATVTQDASGDCLGATFTLNGQPWAPFGSTGWTSGVPNTASQDVCFEAPGTWHATMHATCAPANPGQGTCDYSKVKDGFANADVVIPPHKPTASLSVSKDDPNHLQINYNYGDNRGDGSLFLAVDSPSLTGGFYLYVNAGGECNSPTGAGTCTWPITTTCTNHSYQVRISPSCAQPSAVSNIYINKAKACPVPKDKTCNKEKSCELCVGHPVHVGSGDVAVSIPLFSIGQAPLPLAFELWYHSLAPAYPAAVPLSPLGNGWTHTFNASVTAVNDPAAPNRLMLLRPDGGRDYYDFASGSLWLPARPRSSTDSLVQTGSEYVLFKVDGSQLHFDAASGHWNQTRDRWGNSITGSYTNGLLTAVTDSEGRQITLTYSAGLLTRVQLQSGESWTFDHSNGFNAIHDPINAGPWRTFEYATDSQGVRRLLTAVRDASGVLLEGHGYDAQDRGVSSYAEGGRDSDTIQYDTPTAGQSRDTHAVDGVATRVTVFTLLQQNGDYFPTQIDGVCPTCGAALDHQSATYDDFDHVLTRTIGTGTPNQSTTSYAYDEGGNVVAMTEAVGTSKARTTTYEYRYLPPSGLPFWSTFQTNKTEPSATGTDVKTTDYAWSANETVLSMTETGRLTAGDSSRTAYTATTTYDAQHRVLSVDGPRIDVADVTTYSYYSDTDPNLSLRGRLHTITDATSKVTTFEDYDGFGTARTVTDPNGVVTRRETDARGRIISTTSRAVPGDPNEGADYTSTRAFDARDRLIETVSPRGSKTDFAYEDGTNRLTDTIILDFAGNQRERRHVTYNLAGERTNEQDQLCSAPSAVCISWTMKRDESYVYDALGRLHEVDHGGASIFYNYRSDGLLASVQDENHSVSNTTYGYDELRRLTSIVQTLGTGTVTTSYAYDVQDNFASVTDPNSNLTSYAYDDFHRLQTQVSPVTGTTAYSYDPAGNLVTTVDANGATTTRTFDAKNRVTTATSSSGSGNETVAWAYDNATGYCIGRLSTMTDPTGSTTYSYDRRGLLKSEQRTIDGRQYASGYGYDSDGNRTSITYPTQNVVSYTYDFAGRPITSAAGTLSFISAASYLPFGPMTSLTYGNNTTKTMQYDIRYRLTENKLTNGAATIADYTYVTDGVGNITQIHDAVDPTYNRDFAYDDLNRLITANTGSSLWKSGAYTYDAMGNLLSRSLGQAPPDDGQILSHRRASTMAVTGQVDRLSFQYQGTTPKIVTATSAGLDHSVSYDAAGNETQYLVGRNYSPRNLLSSVIDNSSEGPTHRIDYGYDGRGVRVSRAESPTPSGTARRHYTYTPELQLLTVTVDDSPNIWGQRRATTMSAGLDLNHGFVWFDGQPVFEGGPARTADPGALSSVSRSRPPTLKNVTDYYFIFTDHLGTPILETNTSSQVAWRAEYEPYGNVYLMRAGARTDQPLRLPGQDLAMTWEGAEENYNVFRWYRAGWGRYTQADPFANDPLRDRRTPKVNDSDNEWFMAFANRDQRGLSRLRPDERVSGTEPYAYASDSPLRFVDPLGLYPCVVQSVNSIADYMQDYTAKPGKTIKGCSYVGTCGPPDIQYLALYQYTAPIGCKCKAVCIFSIDLAKGVKNGQAKCIE